MAGDVDRTGCGSAWYALRGLVLTWFLGRWHIAPDIARDLVVQAIGGGTARGDATTR